MFSELTNLNIVQSDLTAEDEEEGDRAEATLSRRGIPDLAKLFLQELAREVQAFLKADWQQNANFTCYSEQTVWLEPPEPMFSLQTSLNPLLQLIPRCCVWVPDRLLAHSNGTVPTLGCPQLSDRQAQCAGTLRHHCEWANCISFIYYRC